MLSTVDHIKNAEFQVDIKDCPPERIHTLFNPQTHNLVCYMEVEWKCAGYHKIWNGYCTNEVEFWDGKRVDRVLFQFEKVVTQLKQIRTKVLQEHPQCVETTLQCSL